MTNKLRSSFKDQMGNTIFLSQIPRRIVSLVPSQTELLFDLGLNEEVAGITSFCLHPKEKCLRKTKIGGTKKFKFDMIDKLNPDLVIGNKEENYREGIEELKLKYPVWMSDIITLEDAFCMIKSIGEMVGKSESADDMISEIKAKMDQLRDQSGIKVAYFIWKKPYMAAGGNTFIDEMLKKCGFINVFKEWDRYPVVTVEQIKEAKPEAILLSSEPYTFKEKHLSEFKGKFP